MNARSRLTIALLLGAFAFCVFAFFNSTHHFGYNGWSVSAAEKMIDPEAGYPVTETGQGGLLAQLSYFVPAFVKLVILPPDGMHSIRQIVYVFVQPAIAALIVMAFFGFASDLYGRRVSVALSLILASGTMIWPYAKIGMENHQTLWTLAAIWMLWRYVSAPSTGRAALAAAALGMLGLTKFSGNIHAAVLFATAWVPVVQLGVMRRPEFKREVLTGFLIGVAALAVLLISNRIRYGGWIFGGRYSFSVVFSTELIWNSLFGIFFGAGKSFFLFSPPALLGLIGLPMLLRRVPGLKPFAAAALALFLIYALFLYYFFDESWGPRLMHWMVPLLVLPAGEVLARLPEMAAWKRLGAGALIALGLFIQTLGVSVSYASHPELLQEYPGYTMEGLTWDPKLSPPVFSAHLIRSTVSRGATGESIPYVIEEEIIPWNGPDAEFYPWVFPMRGEDHWDIWWIQEAAVWRERGQGFWFDQAASWIAVLLALGALASGAALVRLARREPGETAANPSP